MRQRLQKAMKRGNFQIGLTLANSNSRETVAVNQTLLAELTAIAQRLQNEIGSPPLAAEALLGLRGVIEPVRSDVTEEEAAARDEALLASFDRALSALAGARAEEASVSSPLSPSSCSALPRLPQRRATIPPARPMRSASAWPNRWRG